MSKSLHIYTDGGARGNPGPSAIGVLVCDREGNTVQEHGDYIGRSTNNVAEYCAVIGGLELAKQLEGSEIIIRTDSELICKQLNGEYRIKSPELRKLYETVKELSSHFESVLYVHVPRTHAGIRHVDRLVNHTLDRQASKSIKAGNI